MPFDRSGSSATTGLTWLVRVAFALVFVVNLQCALSFALFPGEFVASYELGGVPGEVAVRGIGVAFLMWNVTYPPFIVSPQRFSVLGWVILAQQLVGLVGESLLLFALPPGHDVLAASITRFIAFDAFGFFLMSAAFTVWLRRPRSGWRLRRGSKS